MDIDSADADNELACTAYVESIMEHLYASEVRPPMALGATLRTDNLSTFLLRAVPFPPALLFDLSCWCPTQLKRRPSHCYMSTVQRDIHANMRGILVDWLVEVSLVSSPPFVVLSLFQTCSALSIGVIRYVFTTSQDDCRS